MASIEELLETNEGGEVQYDEDFGAAPEPEEDAGAEQGEDPQLAEALFNAATGETGEEEPTAEAGDNEAEEGGEGDDEPTFELTRSQIEELIGEPRTQAQQPQAESQEQEAQAQPPSQEPQAQTLGTIPELPPAELSDEQWEEMFSDKESFQKYQQEREKAVAQHVVESVTRQLIPTIYTHTARFNEAMRVSANMFEKHPELNDLPNAVVQRAFQGVQAENPNEHNWNTLAEKTADKLQWALKRSDAIKEGRGKRVDARRRTNPPKHAGRGARTGRPQGADQGAPEDPTWEAVKDIVGAGLSRNFSLTG